MNIFCILSSSSNVKNPFAAKAVTALILFYTLGLKKIRRKEKNDVKDCLSTIYFFILLFI